MQQMARKNEWPLDKMALQCDVTKKSREDIGGAPREGAYVHGLYMEGARWDSQTGTQLLQVHKRASTNFHCTCSMHAVRAGNWYMYTVCTIVLYTVCQQV